MAITTDGGRQWPLYAKVPFALADFGASGVAENALQIPAGASVISASVTVTTAFDSATSDTLDVAGGGITLTGADGQALGSTEASAIDSTAVSTVTDITVEWTEAGGGATTGAGFVLVGYVLDGKANEVQPA